MNGLTRIYQGRVKGYDSIRHWGGGVSPFFPRLDKISASPPSQLPSKYRHTSYGYKLMTPVLFILC